jgi:hypothetical protein
MHSSGAAQLLQRRRRAYRVFVEAGTFAGGVAAEHSESRGSTAAQHRRRPVTIGETVSTSPASGFRCVLCRSDPLSEIGSP